MCDSDGAQCSFSISPGYTIINDRQTVEIVPHQNSFRAGFLPLTGSPQK